ncbi:MAG: hypothetical protein U1E28_13685 [Beijerinckiaceae bacterium]
MRKRIDAFSRMASGAVRAEDHGLGRDLAFLNGERPDNGLSPNDF